jgi:hypothetical protein
VSSRSRTLARRPRPAVALAAPRPAGGASRVGLLAAHLWPRLPVLGLIGLVLASYLPFIGTGFSGTDSLPLIETSRVLGWSDLLRQLEQPVMAGTSFTSGELIYRPVVSLTFAADYLLWGLNAAGYHLTNILFHLATCLGVYALLRTLGLARWSSLIGAAVFALHPTVVAAVPVIARRDNLVSAAAFCWALVCLSVAVRGGHRWRLALLGGLVLFAAALLSKEMAFGAAPLVPLVMLGAWQTAPTHRGRHDLPQLGGLLGGFAALGLAVFGLRYAVLGALGGYAGTSLLHLDTDAYRHVLVTYAQFLFWPLHAIFPPGSAAWLVGSGVVLLVVLGASLAMPRRLGLLVAFGCAWVVDLALFYTLLKTFTGAWYLYYGLVGAALTLGASLEWSAPLLARTSCDGAAALTSRRTRGTVGLAALVLVAGLGFTLASLGTSSLLRPYPLWAIDGAASAKYLGAVTDCARGAPDGAELTFEHVPDYLEDADADQTDLLVPTLVYEHTLASTLRLALPDRHDTVVVISYNHLRSPGDHLAVQCQPTPRGRQISASS